MRLNVVILGPCQSGKSLLLHRLTAKQTQQSTKDPSAYMPTMGGDVRFFHHENMTVKLNDISGSSQFYFMRKELIHHAQLFIIVVDPSSKTFTADIEKCLDEIEENATGAFKILLLVNGEGKFSLSRRVVASVSETLVENLSTYDEGTVIRIQKTILYQFTPNAIVTPVSEKTDLSQSTLTGYLYESATFTLSYVNFGLFHTSYAKTPTTKETKLIEDIHEKQSPQA